VNMAEVRASIRRHWSVTLVILLLIPVVMGIYLAGRDVETPPDRFTISADLLIPARGEGGDEPEDVPPVLLQGQVDLALSPAITSQALELGGVEPDDVDEVDLSAALSEDQTIMTLKVSTPADATSQSVLDGYIYAYEEGRRASVRQAALELQDTQKRVVRVLERRIGEVQDILTEDGVPLPEVVSDGDPITVEFGTSSDNILYAYERNALLNERVRRQVDYSLQSTRTEIPGKFSQVVQRRATARISPPPPSPLVPLLQILGIGLLLAVAIPVVMDRLDGTITEVRSAPATLRAGLLATIPPASKRRQRALAPPGSPADLAFRSLAATSISTDRLPRAIMVTSPAGTTQDYVAANFAAGLAGLGVTVALVATLPRQDWFLNAVPEEGDDEPAAVAATANVPAVPRATAPGAAPGTPATFTQLLEDAQTGQLGADLRSRLTPHERPNLFVIPPGDDETALSLDGLPPLLEGLATSEIDVVVIAGPEFVRDPNATIIAWSTRHVLWGIELGQVEKSDAALAAERLELAGVEPFGIALLKRHARRS
jgi:Mrp family chromosome partitioning ATPase